jgi:anti-anti-sigma factor
MSTPAQAEPLIRVERHGTIAVLIPSPEVVALPEHPLQQAATVALAPLEKLPPTGIVMDLSQVEYFGSLFISFLIRCHRLAKESGGRMAVAGASGNIQQLLRLSALDSLWPFHREQAEAVQALTSAV